MCLCPDLTHPEEVSQILVIDRLCVAIMLLDFHLALSTSKTIVGTVCLTHIWGKKKEKRKDLTHTCTHVVLYPRSSYRDVFRRAVLVLRSLAFDFKPKGRNNHRMPPL